RYQAAAAMALAGHGALDEALGLATHITRPLDRARALAAITRAAAQAGQRERASTALGEALQTAAALGRRETFQCLAWAADALAALGGAELLLAASGALDEIDSWWG
ncbi:MAG TPA: hypothetical protein VNL77_22970, partial [Roseiflexaceae bacterium]|nr:hypothetical protein [Roseiflexaceae bacterium]